MADVIICLGNILKPIGIKRVNLRTGKTVELYKNHAANKIIFTGGFTTGSDLSEAKFMYGLAVELSIPEKDIILEEQANTTVENAYYSNKIMDKHGFKSAIIVTSPQHMRRTKYIFKRIIKGKELIFEESKGIPGFFRSFAYYLKEIKELINLKIRGIEHFK